jgi:hypothetical protein
MEAKDSPEAKAVNRLSLVNVLLGDSGSFQGNLGRGERTERCYIYPLRAGGFDVKLIVERYQIDLSAGFTDITFVVDEGGNIIHAESCDARSKEIFDVPNDDVLDSLLALAKRFA